MTGKAHWVAIVTTVIRKPDNTKVNVVAASHCTSRQTCCHIATRTHFGMLVAKIMGVIIAVLAQ